MKINDNFSSATNRSKKCFSICVLSLFLSVSLIAQIGYTQPHIVFVVGENEYRSEQTMPELAKVLSEHYDFRTTVLIDDELQGGEDNNIKGLDALETADLLILYLRFRQLPDEQLAQIQRYIDKGGPILAFRTTTHAFAYEDDDPRAKKWNNFGAREIGAPWIYHYGHGASTDATTIGEHPILIGVSPEFHIRSWTYHVKPNYPPNESQVLVQGRPVYPEGERGEDETVNPIAWTHAHSGEGRVFTTTMGHPEDFRVSDFRRLIANAVHWCMKQEAPKRYTPGWSFKTGQQWRDMNYGPFISTAVAANPKNLTYKGIIIPLTPDRENGAVVFDTDLLRYSAGWIDGLINFSDVEYNGWHQSYPSIEGKLLWQNPVEPGWAQEDSFKDTRTLPFGPLPKNWAHWKGLYLHQNQVILSYTVGTRPILETPSLESRKNGMAFTRAIHLGPSKTNTLARIATMSGWETSDVMKFSRGSAVAFYPSGKQPGAKETLLAAVIDAPNGTEWDTVQDEIRIRFPASQHPISVKILITPTIQDTLDINSWIEFVEESPITSDLTKLIEGGPKRWNETLTTIGNTDIQRKIRIIPQELNHQKRLWTVEREGYTPKLLSMNNLSPAPNNTGNANQYFAVLMPNDESTRIKTGQKHKSNPNLIGYWGFEEGEGLYTESTIAENSKILLDNVQWEDGRRDKCLVFSGDAEARFDKNLELDFDRSDLTFAVWINTKHNGSIFSETLDEPEWIPNGKTFFIRNGQLAFDIGWVGVISSATGDEVSVIDGNWHHVGLTWKHKTGEVKIFLDGEIVAEGVLKPNDELEDDIWRLGYTSENFPEQSPRLQGKLDELQLYKTALSPDEMHDLYKQLQEPPVIATALVEKIDGAEWIVESENILLNLPPNTSAKIIKWEGSVQNLKSFANIAKFNGVDPTRPFMIDKIDWPEQNPWDSWIRFGGFDFFPDGKGAALSTWNGDVWIVTGLDENLEDLQWKRIAAGLNQPLGLKVVNNQIYVAGRDQITRLVDLNDDGEIDYYENFNNDVNNSEHFHEQVMDLQTDADGNFYYMKSARHALTAQHPHHGTLIRVTSDGEKSDVIAYGFRASNGLGISPGPILYGTDQEGFWMPANRINRITTPPKFFGNLWGWYPPGEKPTSYELPLCWIAPFVDRSPAAPVWIPKGTWGEMQESLLLLSYGRGKAFLVLQHEVDGKIQGALTELGVELPTGIMRGRFHPDTGDLYLAGLFGWSSDKRDDTGFYRVRRTGTPLRTPKSFRAVSDGLIVNFYTPLEQKSAENIENWEIQSWEYRWTKNYGSPQLKHSGEKGRDTHTVQSAILSEDGKSVYLKIPTLKPTMQFHVNISVNFADGTPLNCFLHGTIHFLEEIADIERN